MDDSVHVQIQVVECGNRVWRNELGCERVPLRDPSEEFGDTLMERNVQLLAILYMTKKEGNGGRLTHGDKRTGKSGGGGT